MPIESFLFREDRMKALYGYTDEQEFREFHCLVSEPASKWNWQMLEDKVDDHYIGYHSLTRVMTRAFSTSENDYHKRFNGTTTGI
ncbi:hypothetical protein M5D96_009488 [Drosophila gunungcola]|uniref:Uncharacterized protein n=1 Tax=Drosophila gunungcola TaxID=103775 RepID=A0A9P9YIP3_9MUSC|nr:hypothetical protein M5D96_009488 [Drosophila gunungcola]